MVGISIATETVLGTVFAREKKKNKIMTKYTLSRLEEAIGQLEALQKGVGNKSQYSWIGEILYDLRIVADEIKEEATNLEVQIKSKENGHRD